MKQYLKNLDYFIWLTTTLWLFIDAFTGYFLNNRITLPISQAYKILILLFIILRLTISGKGYYITLWLIYVSIIIINCSLINESINTTLILLSKLILTVCYYIYFKQYARNNIDTFIYKSKRILIISFYFVSINILSGLFGIGYHTYPYEGIGFKGFFFAGNELGGVLAVLTPFYLYYIIINYNKFKYFLASIFCILLSILLGTKSFILISAISSVIIGWIYGDHSFRIKIIFSSIIIILLTIPIIINLINSNEVDLLVRLSYSYDKGGLASLIFSSRDEFWIERSKIFYQSSFLNQLLGLGGNRTVEMDLFDTILNFGYLGLTLVIGFITYIIYRSIKLRTRNSFSKTVVLINFLLVGMSLISGHIIFSSMAGMFISLINVITGIKKEEILFNNRICD